MKPEEYCALYPILIDKHSPRGHRIKVLSPHEAKDLELLAIEWKLLFHIVIDNKICDACVNWGAEELIGLERGDPVIIGEDNPTIWDLLVFTGVYPSKSKAIKDWKGPKEIPSGFTWWRVGKAEKTKVLVIWNPTYCTCICHEWDEYEIIDPRKTWRAIARGSPDNLMKK